MSVRVPFIDLALGEEAGAVRDAIARVIDSGWFVLGPEVEAFEQEFAAASGAPYAVGVGNGTDALALILRALGIGAGQEVITTPLSAAYTAIAIVMAGARPVFADIDPERMTLDPRAVERAITDRTAALLPVHLYGQPADMPALAALAQRKGLALVEDCCQAHIATCAGQPVGTFGEAGAFSFYPTKNLGALGDGGAIITRDAALAARIARLRNGGQTDRYRHVEMGVNSRLDEMQAAILRARLPLLARRTAQRRSLAAQYRSRLSGASVTVPPEFDPGHVYHLFPIKAPRRTALQDRLRAAGVETLVHYPIPISQQPAFASTDSLEYPHAARAANEVLSLPLHPGLSPEIVAAVADAVRKESSVRALITGGAGFIGSHLAEALLNDGHDVDIIDNLSTGSIRNVDHLKTNPRFNYTIDTLTNEPLLAELVDRNDVIFHFAAAVGVKLIVEEPVHTIETNVHGTEVVLKHANKKRKKVVIASTSEVYGKSADVPFREDADLVMGATVKHRWAYACSKAIDEFLALAYYKERGLPVIIVRFFNTVGPRQTGQYGMVLPSFVRQALAGEPITVFGDGTQSRSFTYVGDVVGCLLKLVNEPKAIGQVFNIGNKEEVTILRLAEMVKARTGSSSPIEFVPYDKAYEEGFEDMPRRVPDLSKISKLVGYEPKVQLDEIITKVIEYFRTHGS